MTSCTLRDMPKMYSTVVSRKLCENSKTTSSITHQQDILWQSDDALIFGILVHQHYDCKTKWLEDLHICQDWTFIPSNKIRQNHNEIQPHYKQIDFIYSTSTNRIYRVRAM